MADDDTPAPLLEDDEPKVGSSPRREVAAAQLADDPLSRIERKMARAAAGAYFSVRAIYLDGGPSKPALRSAQMTRDEPLLDQVISHVQAERGKPGRYRLKFSKQDEGARQTFFGEATVPLQFAPVEAPAASAPRNADGPKVLRKQLSEALETYRGLQSELKALAQAGAEDEDADDEGDDPDEYEDEDEEDDEADAEEEERAERAENPSPLDKLKLGLVEQAIPALSGLAGLLQDKLGALLDAKIDGAKARAALLQRRVIGQTPVPVVHLGAQPLGAQSLNGHASRPAVHDANDADEEQQHEGVDG